MGSTIFVMDAGTTAKRPTHKVGAANYTAGKRRAYLAVHCLSVVCRSSAASAGCNGDHSTAAGGIDNQFVYQKYSKTQTAV